VVREGTGEGSTLSWFIRLSNGGGLLAASFGATQTDLSAQNDYDGDGKTDIAVWRDTTGTFFVRSSLNNAGLISTQWGATNDFPVASYDTH